MCSVQLLTSTIQLLCISILETLVHVTMKRQAEISADIFAHLLWYFSLSCKNLTNLKQLFETSVFAIVRIKCIVSANTKLMDNLFRIETYELLRVLSSWYDPGRITNLLWEYS